MNSESTSDLLSGLLSWGLGLLIVFVTCVAIVAHNRTTVLWQAIVLIKAQELRVQTELMAEIRSLRASQTALAQLEQSASLKASELADRLESLEQLFRANPPSLTPSESPPKNPSSVGSDEVVKPKLKGFGNLEFD